VLSYGKEDAELNKEGRALTHPLQDRRGLGKAGGQGTDTFNIQKHLLTSSHFI
jgi:hypothetical protein